MPVNPANRGENDHVDVGCPYCGPHRRSPANQTRRVMRIWRMWDDTQTFYCTRCGAKGVLGDQRVGRIFPVQDRTPDAAVEGRIRLAQTLWQASQPLSGTPAEHYLRQARGIMGSLPPTLRYLPPRGQHSHALIAAFGLLPETSCGELLPPKAPPAVHLTRLTPDASGRLDKIMIGPVSGNPIMLAAVNDGLGLVIAEGIEDALSLHEATGLGAWAAGSATHLAKLAPEVPGYVNWVTIAKDDDEAGRRGANALARALAAREMLVNIMSISEVT